MQKVYGEKEKMRYEFSCGCLVPMNKVETTFVMRSGKKLKRRVCPDHKNTSKYVQAHVKCEVCGLTFITKSLSSKYCDICRIEVQEQQVQKRAREWQRRNRRKNGLVYYNKYNCKRFDEFCGSCIKKHFTCKLYKAKKGTGGFYYKCGCGCFLPEKDVYKLERKINGVTTWKKRCREHSFDENSDIKEKYMLCEKCGEFKLVSLKRNNRSRICNKCSEPNNHFIFKFACGCMGDIDHVTSNRAVRKRCIIHSEKKASHVTNKYLKCSDCGEIFEVNVRRSIPHGECDKCKLLKS